MEVEIWMDIKGYEGQYQISNLGIVKSLTRRFIDKNGNIHVVNSRFCKRHKSLHGYLKVVLCTNSKRSNFTVHRLVATHFLANPENKRTINHKNGIKTDNQVSNLEWSTHSENIQHAIGSGLFGIGENHNRAKLTDGDVKGIRKSKLKAKEISDMYGVTKTTVYMIKRGAIWKHLLCALLLLISTQSFSQTVLPNGIIDSLIFETIKGRNCDSLAVKLDNEIFKQGQELLNLNLLVDMQSRQISTSDSLISNVRRETLLVQEMGDIVLRHEKKKSRRFKIAAVLEFIAIILLL